MNGTIDAREREIEKDRAGERERERDNKREMQRGEASQPTSHSTNGHEGDECFIHTSSSSSLHSEACNAAGASDGVIHHSISHEAVSSRVAANNVAMYHGVV